MTYKVLGACIMALLGSWGGCALWFQTRGDPSLKVALVVLWVLFSFGMIAALWSQRTRLAVALFALAFGLMLLWWHRLAPSNDRVWVDDVARMTGGSIDGDQVVLRNVRNFDWRSATDYQQRWETRTYDLAHLSGVDMILSYWSIHAIAHVLISFGFDDGQHVVFSVEIRPRKGEAFSELGGFFKQFELIIVAADERDVVRVRTNVRGEDDYLYRIQMPKATMRSLFAAYVAQANQLQRQPRFYSTITVNCTTLVYHMMNHIVGNLPLSPRLLFSGYLPEYVYKARALDMRYPLEQLRAMGRITQRARNAGDSDAFSQDIRVGVPAVEAP